LLSGIRPDKHDGQTIRDSSTFSQIFRYFTRLLDSDPYRGIRSSQEKDNKAVYELSQIIARILLQADVGEECKIWLEEFVPELEATISALEAQNSKTKVRKDGSEIVETKQTLASRLEMALTAIALDQYMRVMFDEWQNNITKGLKSKRLQTPSTELAGLLPIPATGRLFGFYYRADDQGERQTKGRVRPKKHTLSVFEYAYVGRWFVMNFHRLRQASDDYPGPNVLALSGTSWLPASTRWHFDVPPQGVLEANIAAQTAISSSTFTFLPQFEIVDKHKPEEPIFVSGNYFKEDELRKIVRELADSRTGQLHTELEDLEKLAKQDPKWKDRQRVLILVNSYDQTKAVARELVGMFNWNRSKTIYGLRQSANDRNTNVWQDASSWDETLNRSDIESFAQTRGKILVAPIQAIGRGYNILNENAIAAFGAIYFLTRPMPHPYDTQAIAVELNSKTLNKIKKLQENHSQQASSEQTASLYKQGLDLREEAAEWWWQIEQRYGYEALEEDERNDLAASTLAIIVQACGRLLRGGVPFHAYFVDAAWGPKTVKGKHDTPESSLLMAMIEWILNNSQAGVEQALYQALAQALVETSYDRKRFYKPPAAKSPQI
jgi:hypothetical protein